MCSDEKFYEGVEFFEENSINDLFHVEYRPYCIVHRARRWAGFFSGFEPNPKSDYGLVAKANLFPSSPYKVHTNTGHFTYDWLEKFPTKWTLLKTSCLSQQLFECDVTGAMSIESRRTRGIFLSSDWLYAISRNQGEKTASPYPGPARKYLSVTNKLI